MKLHALGQRFQDYVEADVIQGADVSQLRVQVFADGRYMILDGSICLERGEVVL